MNFLPDGFDPRGDVIGALDLCEIDTPDGPARFMIGVDGIFTDINGIAWAGSKLISGGGGEVALNGEAPRGELMLNFFETADENGLISQVRALGADYIKGRAVRFYTQVLRSMDELSAPVLPPVLYMTRRATSLSFSLTGYRDRSITLRYESLNSGRAGGRALQVNTTGHAMLIGEANPSLEEMPTSTPREELLWGL